MTLTAIIGLDRELADPIRLRVRSPQNRVLIYDTVPKGYADGGILYIEDPAMVDQYITPDIVLFYSYFEGILGFRKAMAFSEIHTFPCVKHTILHDDKDLSLILRANFSNMEPLRGRGYVPGGSIVKFSEERVVKMGNSHCGDDKFKWPQGVCHIPDEDSLTEPFIVGESYRVLVIGNKTWAIFYESEDWRKNVGGKQTLVSLPDIENYYLEQAHSLSLSVAGFDFIFKDWKVHDLEVNCYPGIPDFAREAFIEEASTFIERSM